MLPDYRDILDSAGRPPDWWTHHGVPRFARFTPRMLGVYDEYAILAEIACHSCDQRFLIGEGWRRFEVSPTEIHTHSLIEMAGAWTFGDPPRHEDGQRRCAGETMSSVEMRIVEAWERDDLDWVRHPELERFVGGPR